MGRDSDWLRAGRSGDRIPVRVIFFRTHPDRSRSPPSLLYKSYTPTSLLGFRGLLLGEIYLYREVLYTGIIKIRLARRGFETRRGIILVLIALPNRRRLNYVVMCKCKLLLNHKYSLTSHSFCLSLAAPSGFKLKYFVPFQCLFLRLGIEY